MDDELRRVGIDEETEERLRQVSAEMGHSFERMKRAILDALQPVPPGLADRLFDGFERFARGMTNSMVRIDHLLSEFRESAADRPARIMCAVPLAELAAEPPTGVLLSRPSWRRLAGARGRRPVRARPGGGARGILRRAA